MDNGQQTQRWLTDKFKFRRGLSVIEEFRLEAGTKKYKLTRKQVGELVHRRALIFARTRGTRQNVQEQLLVEIAQGGHQKAAIVAGCCNKEEKMNRFVIIRGLGDAYLNPDSLPG